MYEPRFYPENYRQNVFARELALGEGMIGWAALHREPALIDDVAKDPRPTSISGIPLESKAAIVIPLVADDRLLGVIRAVKMGAGTYTSDHFRRQDARRPSRAHDRRHARLRARGEAGPHR